jgi:hypothetical protein
VIKRQFTQVVLCIGLALGAATMVTPAQGPAASAHASGIDLGALMTKALDNVHSFMVVTDSTTKPAPASPGGVMKMHIAQIFIRRGSGFVMSRQTTTDGKFTAEVFTGTHVCLKKSATAAWDCTLPLAYAKAMMVNFDPVKAYKAAGIVMTNMGSVGTRSIKGQSCTGYRFAMSMSSIDLTGHGTMWFSTANGRVVQIDDTSTVVLVAGSAPMVIAGTSSYRRWDDTSLRLPAVPAS